VPILRTTGQFFSARFARTLSVPPLLNLFRRLCLSLSFEQKRLQYTNSYKIKSTLQIYVRGVLSRSETSGPQGTMIQFLIFGQVAFSAPPLSEKSLYAYERDFGVVQKTRLPRYTSWRTHLHRVARARTPVPYPHHCTAA